MSVVSLIQAALPHTGPTWQSVAMIVIGALDAILLWMLGQSSQDRREMRADITTLRDEVKALNTHVGVDGNGIISRLDTMGAKLDRIAEEMAEARGRR